MEKTIRAIDGSEPHPSWGGWDGFLASCEVRDKCKGVTFYGKVNCNFILFPNGLLIQNYGYWGKVLMQRVRRSGWRRVLRKIQRFN